MSIADEIFAPNIKSSISQAPVFDKERPESLCPARFATFPDNYQEIDDMVVTDDHLVLQIKYSGTHQGGFLGVPPTGKSVAFRIIGVNRIENGLIVENTVVSDVLGILQQIGAIPVPGQTA